MTPELKREILATLAAASALIGVAIPWINGGCTSSPDPSPGPSMAPSPSPSSSPRADLVLHAMRGEVLGRELVVKSCDPLPVGFEVFEIRRIRTLVPSFQGVTVGDYDDPLVPAVDPCSLSRVWVDVAAPQTAGVYTYRVYGNTIDLRVIDEQIPARPTIPFYVAVGSNVHLAHGLPDTVSNQGPMIQKYSAMIRAHRIEPFGQNITNYPRLDANGNIDFDYWSQFGGSFRQLVLDGSIAPPMVLRWVPSERPSTALLRAFQSAIQAQQLPWGSWYYLWDEQESLPTTKPEALARAQNADTYAPSLSVMVTWRHDPNFAPYVNTFMPSFEFWTGQENGAYVSCMAQGSCTSAVGTPSGTPMMLIDSPRIHQRAFPVAVQAMGARVGLYYMSTLRLRTSWDPGGQWNEGGNGDGTLLYTCANGPCASLRLKYLRAGINDVEWIELARRRGIAIAPLATGPRAWSRDESEYETMRSTVASAVSQ